MPASESDQAFLDTALFSGSKSWLPIVSARVRVYNSEVLVPDASHVFTRATTRIELVRLYERMIAGYKKEIASVTTNRDDERQVMQDDIAGLRRQNEKLIRERDAAERKVTIEADYASALADRLDVAEWVVTQLRRAANVS